MPGLKSKMMVLSLVIGLLLVGSNNVHAVPSYARQTGMSCYDCHTVFPELTPAGESL